MFRRHVGRVLEYYWRPDDELPNGLQPHISGERPSARTVLRPASLDSDSSQANRRAAMSVRTIEVWWGQCGFGMLTERRSRRCIERQRSRRGGRLRRGGIYPDKVHSLLQ